MIPETVRKILELYKYWVKNNSIKEHRNNYSK